MTTSTPSRRRVRHSLADNIRTVRDVTILVTCVAATSWLIPALVYTYSAR